MTINPLPNPTITLDDVICLEGSPIIIIGDPTVEHLAGIGVIGDQFDPAIAGNAGIYSATYTYTDANGCTTAVTDYIEVIHHNVDAGMDVYIPEYTTTVITASAGATFLWEPPTGLDCTDCPSPIVDNLLTTTYTVTSWDIYGCVDSDAIVVNIVPVFDPVIFIPNTFTPNGDNINDYFFAFGSDLESILSIYIYDRWGELLFVTENLTPDDPSKGWDGTFNGQQLNQGVYVYMVEVMLEAGVKQQIQGNITLIR